MTARMSPRRKPKADRRHDVDLAMPPMTDVDGNEVSAPKKTARGLLLEAQDEFKQHERRRWPKAILNERYIGGEQQWGVNKSKGSDELVVDWPDWLPQDTRNLLANLHLTAKARVTRGDPSMKAWGGDASMGDRAGADVANKLIYAKRTAQDHRKTISRAAGHAGAQGTGCFYTTWNPAAGPVGEDGVPQGDVSIEALQIFDWATDGSEEIEKSPYCWVRRWMKPEAARKRLLAVGIDETPEEKTLTSVWGDTDSKRVEAIEFWVKPDRETFPNGLMFIFIGGHVVEAHGDVDPNARGNIPGGDRYPYEHNELPLSTWKWRDSTDSPFGTTPCDDAIPLQSRLNRLHAQLAFITAKCARWLKVETTKKNVAKWNSKDQVMEGDPANPTKIIGPPPPPALLYTQIEEAERMLREVYGINEAVVGSDASKSKNAKHLEHIEALDAQKLLETIVNRDHALHRVYRQMLRLLRQMVVVERLLHFIGEDGLPQVQAFVGADLDGVDIFLEPVAGADQTRAAEAANAEQSAVAGFEDPRRAAELRQTGQQRTGLESAAARVVQQQIKDAARGFAAQPDPSVPPPVAVAEIQLALEQATGTPAEAPLRQLLAAYQAAAAPPEAAPAAPAPVLKPKSSPLAAKQPQPGGPL